MVGSTVRQRGQVVESFGIGRLASLRLLLSDALSVRLMAEGRKIRGEGLAFSGPIKIATVNLASSDVRPRARSFGYRRAVGGLRVLPRSVIGRPAMVCLT